MENFSIKLETIGNIQMKMIEIKGNVKTNSEICLLVDLISLGKESVNFKTGH